MSISVDSLFKTVNLKYSKPYKWNEKLDANINGVYVISTSNDPLIHNQNKIELNICQQTFNSWLNDAPNLEIENEKVFCISQVKHYLMRFWDENENILYIGESTSKTNPIQKRINQFYIHKVGKKGPHTGGYWIKLLSCLDDLYIYFAESQNPRETEFKMILKYVELKSGLNLFELDNIADYFPFANSKVDLLKINSIKNHVNRNKRENYK
ncbi:hypothetical protein [Flavobacterium sp. MK4S-17]|uniref:hypothetical protein n=1 Tax=Flavobacterium sp. MK4S-17 TaxID=2543737 RepID=UPI001357DA1F|nr:hypothetical protein [Flavobacterium sp. MK4S-17]